MTKILLMNIPSGAGTMDFPPVGISRVMEGLDPALGCEAEFFDLARLNPSLDEVHAKIRAAAPQVIGFSAVVTVSYAYLKRLSASIKKEFPGIVQIMGGEMAVISNIVVQRTAIDFCVTGESEPTFSELLARLQRDGFAGVDRAPYKDIKGLVFMLEGLPYFTGYADDAGSGIRQINYDLLAKHTAIGDYLPPVPGPYYQGRICDGINHFFGLFREENLNKRMLTVFASNGCSNRCTFCHRFFKGYRVIDPDTVIEFIERNREKYGIGTVAFMEEDFGEHKQATARLVTYLKESGLNWTSQGTKVKTITEEILKDRKEAGCVHIGLGVESCSEKILRIMDKRTTVQENLNALRLLNKYDIITLLSLVVGMPGETDETIEETVRNLSTVIPDDFNAPFEVNINYFLAVPGTPGYEFARRKGLIGQSLDEEERYIEGLFNARLTSTSHYLNFTDLEAEETAYWKDYILLELVTAYMRKHGVLRSVLAKKANRYKYAAAYMLLPAAGRKILLKYLVILKSFGARALLSVLRKKFSGVRTRNFGEISGSLRELNKLSPLPVRPDDASTYILREGR